MRPSESQRATLTGSYLIVTAAIVWTRKVLFEKREVPL